MNRNKKYIYPKICTSILGQCVEEIEQELMQLKQDSIDIVEWRLDFFKKIDNFNTVCREIDFIKKILPNIPLIVTVRTENEGGNFTRGDNEYFNILKKLINIQDIDYIDLEFCHRENIEFCQTIDQAHHHNKKIILSYHNFYRTPAFDDIIFLYDQMNQYPADMNKLAFMPHSFEDVQNLVNAGKFIHNRKNKKLYILISMGEIGKISRILSECMGSCITFGSSLSESAPGQISVDELKKYIQLVHDSINE